MTPGGEEVAEGTSPLATAWRRSSFVAPARSVHASLGTAASTSRTSTVLERVRWLIGTSGLYRWFTSAPPDRHVVVDLRDSRLLGPVVPVATTALTALSHAWDRSMTRRSMDTIGHTLRGAPVRTASAFVLLLVVGSLLSALLRSTPVGAGSTSILTGLALLGLREGRSWDELADTPIGGALATVFEPPEDRSQR